MRSYSIELILVVALAAAVAFFGYLGYGLLSPPSNSPKFSGERALEDVTTQVDFGPRVTGSPASLAMTEWLTNELRTLGWDVAIQPFVAGEEIQARNIIAIRSGPEGSPVALIGARYDSRLIADRNANTGVQQPTPGANNGASGTAVLLELARTLDVEATGHTVCLAFFDAGSNDALPGWQAFMGSKYFVEFAPLNVQRCSPIRAAVLLGVVGDADQQILQEQNGNPELMTSIWSVADELDYGGALVTRGQGPVTAEHIPFLQAGIPAVFLNDANYPQLNTTQDTPDRVSAESLEQVGRILEAWLEEGAPY